MDHKLKKKIVCAANLPLIVLHYLKSCQINNFPVNKQKFSFLNHFKIT